MQNRSLSDGITACRRCGTCCKKGGPTLHEADRGLVEQGHLPLRLLVTIRKGEIVREPEKDRLVRAGSEMIKLKGAGTRWCCILFDASENRCTEYDRRPAECRAMACWDTADIERIMQAPRLSRRDLLRNVEGLWDLVENHEKRCNLGRVSNLAEAVGRGGETAAADLLALLAYDRALRDLLLERGADAGHLDFLLGRTVERLIDGFGLLLVREGGKARVVMK